MDIFDKMFGEFQTSASRVEILPIYHIEGGEWEEFEQYRKGIPIRGFANRDWIDLVATWKKSGKEIKRIRVIPTKLTEYLCYEFEWCYPRNWIAGEVIRVIGQKTYKQLSDPETRGDFWVFDDKYVLQMNYDEDGRYTGERLISEQELKAKYVSLSAKLEQKSIPYTNVMELLRKAKLEVSIE